jgi:thioredoxin-related protein
MARPHYLAYWCCVISALIFSLPSSAMGEKKHGTFSGVKSTEYPGWFKESFLDFEDDIAEAKDSGKRILMLWHQNGCPYCNALVERNLSQKDIETKVRKNFDVVAMNMWGDRNLTIGGKSYTEKEFAEALKVQFTPTLMFLNEEGNIILRLNGYLPPRRFNVALDYVAKRKEHKIKYRDYVAKNVPPGKKGHLNQEDFFASPPYILNTKPQVLAVFFEQKDCPNCDKLHKNVLADKETRTYIKKFKNIQLDMWSKTAVVTPSGKQTTAREWAKKLDIKYSPTIVLFNEKGQEIIRSESSFKVFHSQSMFDYVHSGEYKKLPSFQRYITERADKFIEQGKDVNIWHDAGK